MKKHIAMLVLALSCCFAAAQEPEYKPYFVSAILRLTGSENTLRIVQGMVVASDTANAQIVFTVMATKQFPQYIVIDVLPSTFEQLFKTLSPEQKSLVTPPAKDGGKPS
ncbi:hypothetical protein RQP54_17955 [Curvibacter sp. APW13]|uniref:hypothetical protein n=1 Tax=Curvibacter sp. APW13 TaxID=3077236 RepID=UPI0028DE72EC|nr:hypothetical protein [Curvibacter sp. APW13]MDT8992762.1 hypothetical protein [Curvibacter sp. APW13]